MNYALALAVKAPRIIIKRDEAMERLVLDETVDSFVVQTHIGRYVFAAQFVTDKTVLDLACGTGYGSHYLAGQGAENTIGSDISFDAINYARKTYNAANLQFVLADATKMPFNGDSFDVITSFETIEHIKLYNLYLSECRRVLKKDGLFLCSTPNKKVTAVYYPPNQYHVEEFYPIDFLDMLQSFFGEVHLFGQVKENLLKFKANQTLDRIVKSSRLRSLREMGLAIQPTIREILKSDAQETVSLQKSFEEVNFGSLTSDRFKVKSFADRVTAASTYIVAVCQEPRK